MGKRWIGGREFSLDGSTPKKGKQIALLMTRRNQSILSAHHRPSPSEFDDNIKASEAIPVEGLLATLRDGGVFTSRNTSKGALLSESLAVFGLLRRKAMSVSELRDSVLRGQMFPRASYENRQRIWDSLNHRYLTPCFGWVAHSLAIATASGIASPDYVSLAYLYFALRDRLTFAIVTQLIWKRWCARSLTISVPEVLEFLERETVESSTVKKWSPSTRTKLAQSILAALRDFGVLRGIYTKQIQRPIVSAEAVFHLLCVLLAEGCHGRAVIEAADWLLFLWSEDDVAKALADLAQRQWIRFERGGRTVILELIRTPEVGA